MTSPADSPGQGDRQESRGSFRPSSKFSSSQDWPLISFSTQNLRTLPHFTDQRFWWSPFMVNRVRLFPWKSASYMELPSMYTYPDPIVNTTVDVPEFNFCAAPCSSVCTIERFATACVCYKVEEWTRLFSCVHHRKPLWSVPYFFYHRTFCTTVCAIKYQAVVHHSEP